MIDGFRGPDRGVLILDAGDALLNVPRAAGPVPPPELARSVTMLRGMGLIGVDGMAVGEAELALDQRELAATARQSGVPLLAANLRDRRGRFPFLQRKLVRSGGVKVGIFAVYEDPAGTRLATERGLEVQNAVDAARRQVAALRGEGAELVVMLAHLGMPRARELAAAVSGIHLGVVGHTGWRTNEPEAVGGKTFLVEAGRRGQVLGHLEVRLGEGWQPGDLLVDDSRRFVLYDEARRELERVRRAAASASSAEVWRTQIEPQAERARLLARQLQGLNAPRAPHSLVARLVELDDTVAEHPAMKALLRGAQTGAVPRR